MTRYSTTRILNRHLARLCLAYRADYRYLAAVRIGFALYLLIRPTDYSWIAQVPAALFQPPPGPFALLSAPPSADFVAMLEYTRVILALALLVGLRTVTISIILSAVLIIGAGLTHSYGKVDHFILFEILPLAMAAAGWGRAWSIDAIVSRSRGRNAFDSDNGFQILLWAITVSFALLTAAVPKAVRGWLNPSREGTRGFVARDLADDSRLGVLTHQIAAVDVSAFWKLLDYATIAAEGMLILTIGIPVLFRIGVAIMLIFHFAVFLTLGIEFDSYIFVYLPFFAAPVMAFSQWLPHRLRFNESM